MIRFSEFEVNYYFGKTKEGKQMVVCKYTAYVKYSYGIKTEYVKNALKDLVSNDNMKFTFVGKAVLASEDAYDEEKGKRIAESKAKIQLFKKEVELNNKVREVLGNLLIETIRCTDNREAILEKEFAHLENIR